jgi:hypothetical protein
LSEPVQITDAEIAAARERGIEPPIDPLHALAYELEGVIIDAERSGFDAVCLDTVKRVRGTLYATVRQTSISVATSMIS